MVQTVHVIRYVSWCINLYIFNEIFKMSNLVILRILNVLIKVYMCRCRWRESKDVPQHVFLLKLFLNLFCFLWILFQKTWLKFSLIMHICCQIWLQYCNSNLHASSNKLIFSLGINGQRPKSNNCLSSIILSLKKSFFFAKEFLETYIY